MYRKETVLEAFKEVLISGAGILGIFLVAAITVIVIKIEVNKANHYGAIIEVLNILPWMLLGIIKLLTIATVFGAIGYFMLAFITALGE